ncbi:hypothetical protein LNP74_02480 [Klebsiella pneumoniae subsp. pneumoniae]|nr:hypothetical protein [Klebsiella pneumoniae subsp. pneumoniae]
MASGTELLLCRVAAAPYPAYNPKSPLAQGLLETAGAGGLNIAETFPEGRGSPHGCGLRAVFLQGRCLGPTRSLQG